MDPHYRRVAIFGSARTKENDRADNKAFEISRGLAEAGFDIVTGGSPGIMQGPGHKSAG